MSPEPEVQISYNEVASKSATVECTNPTGNVATKQDSGTARAIAADAHQALSQIEPLKVAPVAAAAAAASNAVVAVAANELLAPRKPRERRNQSPASTATISLFDTFPDAMSPASSSSASQATSADVTFEPTIEMMVNDFDDEGTLNEEEALAAQECQDPRDEIATLREESEMPLEELLAKYSAMPPMAAPPPKKRSKKLSKQKSKKKKRVETENRDDSTDAALHVRPSTSTEVICNKNITLKEKQEQSVVILIESGDELEQESEITEQQKAAKQNATVREVEAEEEDDEGEDGEVEEEADGDGDEDGENVNEIEVLDETTEMLAPNKEVPVVGAKDAVQPKEHQFVPPPTEVVKMRRSHLMDLYPEETFKAMANQVDGKVLPLEMLYAEEEDEEDDDDVEEDETDSDYVKKTIMVGSAYQAVIPAGLSQYGDVLPYENEDKLIWEPSQVSEREVEEYLLKAREVKPSSDDEEQSQNEKSERLNACLKAQDHVVLQCEESGSVRVEELKSVELTEKEDINEHVTVPPPPSVASSEADSMGVVKDNEQALHLLVQCGYDFKEALRRKRLNAMPMTRSMSIWSEEECQKFEEGIQKFGKDFLKIRQNQVRTRSMRELVQFYYLWKKSERRDQSFANANTVDHMDIYLDEGSEYGASSSTSGTTNALTNVPIHGARKAPNYAHHKNLSMMASAYNVLNATEAAAAAATNAADNGSSTLSPETAAAATSPPTTATTNHSHTLAATTIATPIHTRRRGGATTASATVVSGFLPTDVTHVVDNSSDATTATITTQISLTTGAAATATCSK